MVMFQAKTLQQIQKTTDKLDFIHFVRFKKCSSAGERLNNTQQKWMAKMQGDIPIIHLCHRHTPEPW